MLDPHEILIYFNIVVRLLLTRSCPISEGWIQCWAQYWQWNCNAIQNSDTNPLTLTSTVCKRYFQIDNRFWSNITSFAPRIRIKFQLTFVKSCTYVQHRHPLHELLHTVLPFFRISCDIRFLLHFSSSVRRVEKVLTIKMWNFSAQIVQNKIKRHRDVEKINKNSVLLTNFVPKFGVT